MSLINQMLTDLEQRQAIAGHSSSSTESVTPYAVKTTEKSLLTKYSIKLSFVLLFITLLSITAYYSYLIYTLNTQPIQPQIEHQAQSTVQLQKKSLDSTSPVVKSTPLASASSPKTIKTVRQSVATLTQPISNIKSATDTGLPSTSPSPSLKIDTATAITEENAKAARFVNNDLSVNQPNLQSITKQRLELHPNQLAEVSYKKGYELLQKNKIYSAESKLLLALEHNNKHIKAREVLVGLYLKTGRKVEAENILVTGLLHRPKYSNFAELYARLLLKTNRINKAVTVLLNHKPSISHNPNYYALLAACYQRNKNHSSAANTYLKLLKLNPNEGIWWVGMAISLEALNKHQQALNAYEKARQSGTLNTHLSNYSSKRLEQLNLNNPPSE